jgi:hypothetical protein
MVEPRAPLDAVVDDEVDRVGVGDVDLAGTFSWNGHGDSGVETGVAVAGVGLRRVVDASRYKFDG